MQILRMLMSLQVVIFDCCHSGSGTRSSSNPELRTRGVRLYEEATPELCKEIQTQCSTGPASRGARYHPDFKYHGLYSHVLLAACEPDQEAQERPTIGGLFTAALLKALKETDITRLTYKGLIDRVLKEPSLHPSGSVESVQIWTMLTISVNRNQRPRCEGPHSHRLLFNSKVLLSPPNIFEAEYMTSARRKGITIKKAGTFLGIEEHTKFKFWPEGEDSDSPLAFCALVKTTEPFQSRIPDPSSSRHSTRLYAQVLSPSRKMKGLVYLPQEVASLPCFQELFNPPDKSFSLDNVMTPTSSKEQSQLALHLTNEGKIGFTIRLPSGDMQSIQSEVCPTTDQVYKALKTIADFCYHRDRAPERLPSRDSCGGPPTQFSLEVCRVMRDPHKGLIPSGPQNLISNGELMIQIDGSNDDAYGIKLHNKIKRPVFPYLFYFNQSTFSVSEYRHSPS